MAFAQVRPTPIPWLGFKFEFALVLYELFKRFKKRWLPGFLYPNSVVSNISCQDDLILIIDEFPCNFELYIDIATAIVKFDRILNKIK